MGGQVEEAAAGEVNLDIEGRYDEIDKMYGRFLDVRIAFGAFGFIGL
jgi:hypothetical protein